MEFCIFRGYSSEDILPESDSLLVHNVGKNVNGDFFLCKNF